MLGGTIFVGRHCVEVALKHGHEVTLFNRGKHNADLFPEVEKIVGDRSNDLDLLKGRKWDAVIDTCGYYPRDTKKSAEALKDSIGVYCFISSVSAYADPSIPFQKEDAPLAVTEDVDATTVTGENYGGLKVLCEKEIDKAFGSRALQIRPTLIVGPDDPTDRFTYWPLRFERGGKIVVPSRREQPTQIIDVRDLSEWIIRLLESGTTGAFTGAGPEKQMTMGEFLDTCRRTINTSSEPVWIDEAFLKEQEVSPWGDLPMWLDAESNSDGMDQMDISKGLANGLTFRSLEQTLRDTLTWAKTRPADYQPRGGLTVEKEQEVLRLWAQR
jgi:2'-hydroxyisoflavone reductase